MYRRLHVLKHPFEQEAPPEIHLVKQRILVTVPILERRVTCLESLHQLLLLQKQSLHKRHHSVFQGVQKKLFVWLGNDNSNLFENRPVHPQNQQQSQQTMYLHFERTRKFHRRYRVHVYKRPPLSIRRDHGQLPQSLQFVPQPRQPLFLVIPNKPRISL